MHPSRRWASTKGSIMPSAVAFSRIHLSLRIAMTKGFRRAETTTRGEPGYPQPNSSSPRKRGSRSCLQASPQKNSGAPAFAGVTKRVCLVCLTAREQARIAARGGRVDGGDALGGEAHDVVRPAGLGAGARQALAAERLAADHRADL